MKITKKLTLFYLLATSPALFSMSQQNNNDLKFDNPELFNKQEQVIITQTPDIPDSLEKKN